jgi:hypothetical protein
MAQAVKRHNRRKRAQSWAIFHEAIYKAMIGD